MTQLANLRKQVRLFRTVLIAATITGVVGLMLLILLAWVFGDSDEDVLAEAEQAAVVRGLAHRTADAVILLADTPPEERPATRSHVRAASAAIAGQTVSPYSRTVSLLSRCETLANQALAAPSGDLASLRNQATELKADADALHRQGRSAARTVLAGSRHIVWPGLSLVVVLLAWLGVHGAILLRNVDSELSTPIDQQLRAELRNLGNNEQVAALQYANAHVREVLEMVNKWTETRVESKKFATPVEGQDVKSP